MDLYVEIAKWPTVLEIEAVASQGCSSHSSHYWHSADVLHICHDSESGIGLQRFGVEGPSHYDEIAVYEIQHLRCLPCGYLRALTIHRRSHGFRVTHPRFQGAGHFEF